MCFHSCFSIYSQHTGEVTPNAMGRRSEFLGFGVGRLKILLMIEVHLFIFYLWRFVKAGKGKEVKRWFFYVRLETPASWKDSSSSALP